MEPKPQWIQRRMVSGMPTGKMHVAKIYGEHGTARAVFECGAEEWWNTDGQVWDRVTPQKWSLKRACKRCARAFEAPRVVES